MMYLSWHNQVSTGVLSLSHCCGDVHFEPCCDSHWTTHLPKCSACGVLSLSYHQAPVSCDNTSTSGCKQPDHTGLCSSLSLTQKQTFVKRSHLYLYLVLDFACIVHNAKGILSHLWHLVVRMILMLVVKLCQQGVVGATWKTMEGQGLKHILSSGGPLAQDPTCQTVWGERIFLHYLNATSKRISQWECLHC